MFKSCSKFFPSFINQHAPSMNSWDSIQFIRGKTKTSINAVYLGYSYSRDGKPTSTHKQAWRCVLRTCKGRMHTVDGHLLSCTQEHNHSADLADCEAKATLSWIIHQGDCSFDKNTQSPLNLRPDYWISVPGYPTVITLSCCTCMQKGYSMIPAKSWSSPESSWFIEALS